MATITSYFSHDSNARNDEKLLAVRLKHGAEGYGVYFMILERLRDSEDYTSVVDYNLIAFDLRVSAGLIKSVVENFGLFSFTEDGKRFYSIGFSRRMGIKDKLSQQKSEAGRRAMEARWGTKKAEKETSKEAEKPRETKQETTQETVKPSENTEPEKEEIKTETQTKPAPETEPEQMSLLPVEKKKQVEKSKFGFILSNGQRYNISVEDLAEYIRIYPGVDVVKELRNMEGWCMSNPKQRKTPQGAKRFITSWLSRTQDSPPHQKPKGCGYSKDAGVSFEGTVY